MSTTLILPPTAAIDQAATELAAAAVGNAARMRAISKAQYHLRLGINIVPVADGFLMLSGTRANIIHKVSFMGACNCEAHGECWHKVAIEVIELAQRYTLPSITRPSVDYDRALAEINELF